MTRDEIIVLASQLTEQKLTDKQVNLQLLYVMRLQKFCMDVGRCFWRKKSITFSTVAGTAAYDLGATAQGTNTDVEEIISVRRVVSITDVDTLTPVFDTAAQEDLITDTTQDPEPGLYFIQPGTTRTLYLSPVPSAVVTMRVSFWALPNPATNSSDATVPLVPGGYHHVLVDGMCMDIFGNLYGPQDPKFLLHRSEYQMAVERIAGKRDFAPGKVLEYVSSDKAVRST